jgi:murein L,D-transpeptidase YcbB/YkuD
MSPSSFPVGFTGFAALRAMTGAFILALTLSAQAVAADGLLWFEHGRPIPQARQAVEILAHADAEGLDPAKYDAATLALTLAAAESASNWAEDALVHFDNDLTEAMRRFLSDLHYGQVDPRSISENYTPSTSSFDPAVILETSVRQGRLREAVAEAAPPFPLYADLRAALAQYRRLARETDHSPLWRSDLPPLPGKKLELGQSYAGLPMLIQRLEALGDMPADSMISTHYTADVVKGVMAFQERHGLEPDGVIGRQTIAALDVSPAARVRQIQLTMERLRWTPIMQAPRTIVVNVPENYLEAYDLGDGGIELKTRMRVITGNAPKNRTPIFDLNLRAIEFSPYWNVPYSIASKELVPELRKYPARFDKQGFEFVSGNRVIPEFSFDALDAVVRGEMRIRQRPGPKNAMGLVKFIMPNRDNIYLHYTASPRLFERYRRDLSHGCVRVQKPVELAKFVLQNDPQWDEARITAAMEGGNSTILNLSDTVRVVIAYKTVRVRDDGQVLFFADVYGQDMLLERALREHGWNADRGI